MVAIMELDKSMLHAESKILRCGDMRGAINQKWGMTMLRMLATPDT